MKLAAAMLSGNRLPRSFSAVTTWGIRSGSPASPVISASRWSGLR